MKWFSVRLLSVKRGRGRETLTLSMEGWQQTSSGSVPIDARFSELAERRSVLLDSTVCSSSRFHLFSNVNLGCVQNVNLKKKKLFSFCFIPERVHAAVHRTPYCCVEHGEVFWERREAKLPYDCRKQILPCVQKSPDNFLPSFLRLWQGRIVSLACWFLLSVCLGVSCLQWRKPGQG